MVKVIEVPPHKVEFSELGEMAWKLPRKAHEHDEPGPKMHDFTDRIVVEDVMPNVDWRCERCVAGVEYQIKFNPRSGRNTHGNDQVPLFVMIEVAKQMAEENGWVTE